MNFSDVTNLVGKMQKVQARRSFIPDKVLRTLNGEQGSAYPFSVYSSRMVRIEVKRLKASDTGTCEHHLTHSVVQSVGGRHVVTAPTQTLVQER